MHYRRLSRSFQVRGSSVSFLFIILLTAGCFLSGCNSNESAQDEIVIEWDLSPTPPVVGESTLHFTLRDTTGQSIENAQISLEATMTHPGMAPVTGRAVEFEPGRYRGEFSFTMGGDWYILIEATLNDETVIEKQITVSGVRPQ